VNAAAAARLERALVSPVDAPGRGILLRAPRAGFGKSHLLAHLQQRL
jgi:ATP/maltotriose-dependent transcriptional regulator MalT